MLILLQVRDDPQEYGAYCVKAKVNPLRTAFYRQPEGDCPENYFGEKGKIVSVANNVSFSALQLRREL